MQNATVLFDVLPVSGRRGRDHHDAAAEDFRAAVAAAQDAIPGVAEAPAPTAAVAELLAVAFAGHHHARRGWVSVLAPKAGLAAPFAAAAAFVAQAPDEAEERLGEVPAFDVGRPNPMDELRALVHVRAAPFQASLCS
jgi:hypothetical protein